MKRNNHALILLIVMMFFGFSTLGHAEEKPNSGFLKVLKVGQTITMKEGFGKYQLTVIDGMKLGHKVIEIGVDYIVLEDLSGSLETYIPFSSIQGIVKIRTPGK